jgi:hypothetical protein
MKNWASPEARLGFRILKRDASSPEHNAPSIEALSRWENEGGAPDRRGEFENRMATSELPLFATP